MEKLIHSAAVKGLASALLVLGMAMGSLGAEELNLKTKKKLNPEPQLTVCETMDPNSRQSITDCLVFGVESGELSIPSTITAATTYLMSFGAEEGPAETVAITNSALLQSDDVANLDESAGDFEDHCSRHGVLTRYTNGNMHCRYQYANGTCEDQYFFRSDSNPAEGQVYSQGC